MTRRTACGNNAVFVRVNRNFKGKAYLQIVRSYRDNGKVKQEVLFTLCPLDTLLATGQLDAITSALSRHCTKQSLIDLAQDVSVEKVYDLGGDHVVRKLMERTGLCTDRTYNIHKLDMAWIRLVLICNPAVYELTPK